MPRKGGGLCYAKSLSSPTVSRLRSIPRRCSNSGYQWRSAGAKINTQSLHRAAAPGCLCVYSMDTWSSETISAEQQPTERTWLALISAPSRPLKSTTTQTTAVSEIFCSILLTPKECASLQQILINYHHTLGTVCFLPNAPSSSHTVSTEIQH